MADNLCVRALVQKQLGKLAMDLQMEALNHSDAFAYFDASTNLVKKCWSEVKPKLIANCNCEHCKAHSASQDIDDEVQRLQDEEEKRLDEEDERRMNKAKRAKLE